MTTLFAQPYDISAPGFYFTSADEFTASARRAVNDYGQPVEEFEIQFIDGEDIDCALADAWKLYQSNFAEYLRAVEDWDEREKIAFIIAIGECGHRFEAKTDDPSEIEFDLYEVDSLRDLAQQFVDEGLFGELPDRLSHYIDYDAIARDLAFDYAMIDIAGTRYAYRCA